MISWEHSVVWLCSLGRPGRLELGWALVTTNRGNCENTVYLNYLPLRFTSDIFAGGVIAVEGGSSTHYTKDGPVGKKLETELRRAHAHTHFFYAAGSTINSVPLLPGTPHVGTQKNFDIFTDFQFANALARQALLDFFTGANQTVVRVRPVTIILEQHNLSFARQDVFGIFPEYEMDVRPLAPHEGQITSGVLVGLHR